MIRLFCYDPTSGKGTWLESGEVSQRVESLKASKDILWVDLECPTEEEEQLVFHKLFPIHALSLEDVTHLKRKPDVPPHFPKVEEFPDYLFVIVNPLAQRLIENLGQVGDEGADVLFENGSAVTQLSAIMSDRMLITHHYESVTGVGELRSHLDKHAKAAERGPDYLFHLIIDEAVDEYAPVLDHLSDTLEDYETALFESPSRAMLTRMIRVKRMVIVLRKTLIYERELLARLSRGEFEQINERETVYYRNVYDHLIRFTELIEGAREMVSDLMQMHLAASANRLNQIMKVLTMISTTVLPMTLIAGIYGMNFKRLVPDTETEYGFEMALGMMAVAGLGSFLLFRWRKWV